MSALVLPITIDDVIATDGGWVRNFPSSTRSATRASARSPPSGTSRAIGPSTWPSSSGIRERLERFRAVPPVRGLCSRRSGSRRSGPQGRAGALPRADRPAHARRDRAQHGARGTALERPRSGGRRAASPPRRGDRGSRPRPPRHGVGGASARSSRRVLRRPVPVPPRPARADGSSCAARRGRAASIRLSRRVAGGEQAGAHRAWLPPDGRGARRDSEFIERLG